MASMKNDSNPVSSDSKMPIDEIDLQMIDLLRKNGRMTNVELAERVGLSPPPCLRRLRFLEEKHVIIGYEAKVNHKKLGYDVKAIIIVRFDPPKSKLMSKFETMLYKLPEVVEMHRTLGNTELIISLISTDLDSYGQFIKDCIQNNNDISSFNSYILE